MTEEDMFLSAAIIGAAGMIDPRLAFATMFIVFGGRVARMHGWL